VNPVTLVRSWRKLLPDLEDDLQRFPNEEISKSEIFDVVCAMSSENIDEEMLKNGCTMMYVYHITDRHCQLPPQNRMEKKVRRMRVKSILPCGGA
jgi:hypothetical protein